MRNSRNAYNFGCETRQKMNERCNELSSMLDSAHAKIDSLTAELKEESSKHRTTLNKVLSVFQKVVPDAMDASAWFKYKGQWSDGEKFGA